MGKARLVCGVSALVLVMVEAPLHAQSSAGPPAQTDPATGEQTGAESAEERAAAQTGEVIVTARKREESLQDVPAVVSAITGQTADDLGGLRNARDITALSPGVTFIESAQGPTAEPNIRGAGQARLPNSDAAIGLYRDGAYIVGGNLGGRTFQRFDLFDMERTEVLRGPQGALYGRNAVGGAINVISRKPSFTSFSGEADLIGGSQKTAASQLIVNVPLSDTFAVRGGFDIESQAGGFYYNSTRRETQDDSYYAAGRLSARWRPSSAFDATIVADYGEQNYDVGSTIQRPDPDRDPFTVAFNTPQRSTAKQFNLGLSATYNLGFAQLVSTSNFRSRQGDLSIDNDGLATASEVNSFHDDAKTYFQELRLQGSEDRFNWLIGADFFHLRDEYDTTQSGRALITTTSMGVMTTTNPNFFSNTDYKQTGYAGFASLEYKLTDAFKLEGEGRYSVDEKSLLIDARRADGTPRYADFPPGSPQTTPSDTFHNFSYGATASYDFNRDVLAFARVATAYRAGGFNSDLGNPCGAGETAGTNCNLIDVPASYGEEHSINYEVGVKSAWFDRSFFLNANVYHIDYDDILANLNNGIMAMNDPLNAAMFLANAGDARADGFEIEMTSRPRLPQGWGRLEMYGSIAHQAGHFTSINPSITTVLPGNKLGRLRPFAYNARVVWRVPADKARRINLVTALNYVYEEGGYISAENDLNLDTTRRANLRVGFENPRWELSLLIQNLFNNRYYVNQSGTGTNGIGTAYRQNDPRSWRATFKVKW